MSFQCTYCDYDFKTKKGYDKHVLTQKHKDHVDISKKFMYVPIVTYVHNLSLIIQGI